MGSDHPCDTWSLSSPEQWFQTLELGYDIVGVTHLKAITNNGVAFERGILKTTDSVTRQTFSNETRLIGLQGYEKEGMIKALGFIKFNCAESIIGTDVS